MLIVASIGECLLSITRYRLAERVQNWSEALIHLHCMYFPFRFCLSEQYSSLQSYTQYSLEYVHFEASSMFLSSEAKSFTSINLVSTALAKK